MAEESRWRGLIHEAPSPNTRRAPTPPCCLPLAATPSRSPSAPSPTARVGPCRG